jgi:hypothetical protein
MVATDGQPNTMSLLLLLTPLLLLLNMVQLLLMMIGYTHCWFMLLSFQIKIATAAAITATNTVASDLIYIT